MMNKDDVATVICTKNHHFKKGEVVFVVAKVNRDVPTYEVENEDGLRQGVKEVQLEKYDL